MGPSNSSESQAIVNANQPEQIETITHMSFDYYNAATEGNSNYFKTNTSQSLDLLRTPNKNTILHIYITALKSGSDSTTPNAGSESRTPNFVKKILKICPSLLRTKSEVGSESTSTLNAGSKSTTNFVEEILHECPKLLQQANSKGETLLHIAARYGHSDIVEVLIKYRAPTLHDQDLEEGIEPVKEILEMLNDEKDTALHEAVRYNNIEIVKLLINKDPDFSYSANNAGETPLYIAAERGFEDVLFEILDKCKSPMHGGPLGRTALHAAVLEYNKGMIERILEKIDGISRKVDNNGWTPLHLAAYINHGIISKQLLDKDREVAYMKDTKGMTPLHIATHRGNDVIMKVIVEMCPDCCELVDNRGWNVLHFAIKGLLPNYMLERIMEIIKEKRSFSNLLNEKNAEGDAPLHFYSKNKNTSLELPNNFISHPRLNKMAFNKQNLNAREIASTVKHSSKQMLEIWKALHRIPRRVTNFEDEITMWTSWKQRFNDRKKEERKSMLSMLQKATEVHLVVAALIATVTFAACITMPGGFVGGEGSHPGSALLKRSAAFKVFVITDTISMVLSSSAVFIHLLMPFLFDKNINDEKRRMKLVVLAFILILGAMVAMGVAFVTGTYAVLVPSLDLAITNCIVGLTFFAIFFAMMEIWKALGRLPRRVINFKDEPTMWTSYKQQFNDRKKEERKSMLSMLRKATEVHLVVAALIATVTFAACITMPGGFVGGEGSHRGSALLRRSAAFKAFVITDTISMVLSSSAVFIHLLMPFLFNKNINDEKRRMKLVVLAFILILGAMVAMGVAFVTGTYAVLVPSLDLAIANCIVGLTFFAIFFAVFGKLFASSFSQLSSFFDLEEIN
ncbi:hypothetical protein FH972_008384 [Carpinus fangiana]|uniref:PGG domain-containing protein n=1 Tax=Carpinus fangiana TaxID=176857 RepID=A0A5N6QYN2_9ROSI|nr:hypothetical protein FH972_008384 [Carpinus fangiana]